jgi:regulator of protease activity HflC (stomatin/prohibitin superfamily)
LITNIFLKIIVVNVEDAAKSTKLLAASTLRNVLGTKSLHEILSDRETVANLIQVFRVKRKYYFLL